MIPLTTACLQALPLHTIRQLVAACPRRALTHPNTEASNNGQLPLHAACCTRHQHSLETVLYLIQEYPAALQVPDHAGNLPLHLAARFASLPVIQAVWQAFPAAIQIRTTNTLSSSSSSSSALKSRIRKKGTGQNHQQNQHQPHQPQRLPFHLAMQEKRDAAIISFLLSKYPAAVRMPDDDDDLVTTTAAVVDGTISSSTTATTTATTSTIPVVVGKLPLQQAIEQNASLEIIQCLVQADRGIMSLPDSLGNLPLHCALLPSGSGSSGTKSSKYNNSNSNSSSTSNSSVYNRLVLYLLRQGPKNAAQIPNTAGDLPLHMACARPGGGCSLSIIAALVRHYPGALRVADALYGKLPLHIAILNNTTSNNPAILHHADDKENNQDESNNNTLLDLVQLLVRKDSQTLQVQDPDGCLALHFALHRHNTMAAAVAASTTKASSTTPCASCQCSLQLIDYLLDQYPQACRVANQCNGQLPLHMMADASSTSSSSSNSSSSSSNNQHQQQEQQQQQQHYYYSYNHTRQLLLLQLIHKIVQRYPNALHIKDAKGCLPMTLACWSQAPLAILECLSSSCSSGDAACSPLLFSCAHLLASSSSSSSASSSLSPSLSLKILQFILAQSPKTAISSPGSNDNKEYSGGLPLHVACTAGASPAVIEYIVRQFESAVAIADGHGRLPLHCACNSILASAKKNAAALAAANNNNNSKQTNADDDMVVDMEMTIQNSCNVMEYLLRVFPAAAAIVDHNGCLPLHHLAVAAAAATSSTASHIMRSNNNNSNNKMSTSLLRIAKLLVQENAGALEHRNHEGYCPWLLAAMAVATTTTSSSSGNNSSTRTTTPKVKESGDTDTAAGTPDPCLDVLFYLAQQSPNSILALVVALTSTVKSA